jgi:hypothetical protein
MEGRGGPYSRTRTKIGTRGPKVNKPSHLIALWLPCQSGQSIGYPNNSTSKPQNMESTTTITLAQRTAIIENFQLEMAERSRKLRAQCNLQAQGLRARLEMRVNRIPHSLRKRNIGEVMDEHEMKSRPAPPPPMAMPVASERKPAVLPPIRSRQAQAQAVKRKRCVQTFP